MKFNSLSDAIRYYASSENALKDAAPYGSLANEVLNIPININPVEPFSPNVIIYGQSIWGIGKIIDIPSPLV